MRYIFLFSGCLMISFTMGWRKQAVIPKQDVKFVEKT